MAGSLSVVITDGSLARGVKLSRTRGRFLGASESQVSRMPADGLARLAHLHEGRLCASEHVARAQVGPSLPGPFLQREDWSLRSIGPNAHGRHEPFAAHSAGSARGGGKAGC